MEDRGGEERDRKTKDEEGWKPVHNLFRTTYFVHLVYF